LALVVLEGQQLFPMEITQSFLVLLLLVAVEEQVVMTPFLLLLMDLQAVLEAVLEERQATVELAVLALQTKVTLVAMFLETPQHQIKKAAVEVVALVLLAPTQLQRQLVQMVVLESPQLLLAQA
jgi:hypothetical protein